MQSQQGVKFSHLTVKDGLSQGTVLCILQDQQGFMWFGTQDGLNRYDGYSFRIFRHDPTDSTSINDNFIVLLAEDSSGTLWVGTLNNPSMLNRFDPRTESFTQHPAESVNLHSARINAVRAQYQDPSGIRWYGSKDAGLKRVDPRTGKTTVYRHKPNDTTSIISDDVFQVVSDASGALWITTSAGLERFDPKTETFNHFRHDDKNPRSINDNETWPILVDRQGTLWVGTYNGGLNRFDRSTESFTHYVNDEANPRSLAGNRLFALYQDRSGMIWVGTGDHGVDRFHPELAAFGHYLHNPSDPSSLADNNIQGMHVDRSGIAWIGTRGGLSKWDRRAGKFIHYKHNDANPGSIGDDNAAVILVDRSGTLWVGTASNGLDRLDPGANSFVHYRNNPSDPQSLSENLVYALCEDREGYLWVGTYGGGLNRFDPKTKRFKVYRHIPDSATSLGAEGVWSLLEDREGVLWVGTYGGGLDRFNRENETFTHFQHRDGDSTSLSDNLVTCLYEDLSGELWVGTTGGLNRFDRRNGTFESFREKDGLANDVVFGILEDGKGRLWMSTNKGVSCFDPKIKKFRNYDYDDGLQGNEFNQGAYAKDPRTGEIFFGGPNGFNIFHPDRIRDNPFIPPVVFTSFVRYNTDDEQGRPITEHGISVKPAIEVSYKDNITTFEFASLSYYNSDKNQYSYMLEGFSENWIQLGTGRRATFTNLDGGEYILRVRGSNNDGVWNEEGTSLKLTVTPPWWKTKWAYGSYFVLFLGFLYGSRKFELDRQQQKARIRESELRAKAAEAEKRTLEVENERKTKELEDARRLQLSMLPRDIPNIPGYEIAVFMKTATEVGGDYYDFSLSPEGNLNIAFGDATGHGMQAGTIVTLMKGLFLSEASRQEIQKFFNHCSQAIKDIKLGRLYMALTLVRLSGKNVSLSSAGMPPAFLHRNADGSIEEILLKAVPLGSMKNYPYGLYETALEAGDTLLLMTDGLPEQKNATQEMFDYARVNECFKSVIQCPPKEIIDRLVKEGDQWMNGVVQDDDITLMVVRRTNHQLA